MTCSYDVKLDFKDLVGAASIKLEWKHAQDAAAFTVIPSGRLAHRFVCLSAVSATLSR